MLLDEEEKLSLESVEKSIVGDGYILPSEGHKVFVIQPGIIVYCRRRFTLYE